MFMFTDGHKGRRQQRFDKSIKFQLLFIFPFDLDLTSFEVITEAHRNGFA